MTERCLTDEEDKFTNVVNFSLRSSLMRRIFKYLFSLLFVNIRYVFQVSCIEMD